MYQCKLVFFEGRGLHFTQAAYFLYDFAKIQSAHQEVLFQKLERIENPVSIVMTLSIADYYFPTSLRSYLIDECVNFQIKVANTETLLEDLKSGVIDCALVEGMFDQDIFTSHIFTEARFMPVVAQNHPLAGQGVSVEELLYYPVIVREQGSGTRSIFENWLTAHNHRLTSFKSVKRLAVFKP
nr:LysR substrate-binding domain-containing protein [Erysipelothrix piscisicarius]